MHANHQQEEFSRAFVHAVVSVAGYKLQPAALPDDDSVDLSIASRGSHGLVRSPRVDVQLKCRKGVVDTDPWSFPLKIKNYDDLRHPDYQAPRILVVVVVPDDVAAWLELSAAQLVLRHCAYWMSLRGAEPRPNERSVTVRIPRGNVFGVDSLRAMMGRLGQGGAP